LDAELQTTKEQAKALNAQMAAVQEQCQQLQLSLTQQVGQCNAGCDEGRVRLMNMALIA